MNNINKNNNTSNTLTHYLDVKGIDPYGFEGFKVGYEYATLDLRASEYLKRPDKKAIRESILNKMGVKYGFARNESGLLIELVDIADWSSVIQYQLIKDNKPKASDNKTTEKPFNTGSTNGRVPIIRLGNISIIEAKRIIVCESPFKAAAVYQSLVYNDSSLHTLVIGAVNVGGVAKAADYLTSINQGDKIIIGCDNDAHKTPEKPINAQVFSAIERHSLKYVIPPNGFKDFDEMLVADTYGDGITDLFNKPREPEKKEVFINPFEYLTGFDGYNNKVSYLIKGYLPTSSMGMVYGGSGEFKSFLVTSWACHIATGIDWNGHKVNQTGVLYIVGEGGSGVPRRVKAWSNKYYNGKQVPNFFRIDRPVHAADLSQSLSLTDTVNKIKSDTGVSIGLIVFDTLARCFSGNENDAGQIGSFIGGIDTVKAETNATVLIVHHSGKDAAKNARGSSAITAACDFEFKVNRPNKDEESTELVLRNTKMKDDEPQHPQAFLLTSHVIATDDDDDEITSLVVNDTGYEPPEEIEPKKDLLSKNQLLIMDAIEHYSTEANKQVSRSDVRDRAVTKGLNKNNFSRNLEQLESRGFISITNKGATLLLTP